MRCHQDAASRYNDMIVENFLQQKTVAEKKKGETAKTATP
jgi:hypothetical protein